MTTMMVMVMTMVVCVSAASLGGCRRDDVKVEGSHPENVSTSLKSHQDANETLDVSTRITINQDVNRTMGDSKQDVTLNLPINETSITPLIFVFPLDDLKPSQDILVRDCPLPTCLTHNLGSSLQHGDETAGRDASDPLGFGKK
ncbi:uncharacterized protein zgc:193726 isoform X5 [Acanthochromis polyacanthus]|uniref:uncharacterized protein zgc:193726 isoform X5 n=1 Tax=Acanthochromis polyacanthus TaxID=80966 RepID=UPI0022345F2C|nr:uncharacterized protein zgc:193726 isoform X5 [Acanthochromis polyacanthus]